MTPSTPPDASMGSFGDHAVEMTVPVWPGSCNGNKSERVSVRTQTEGWRMLSEKQRRPAPVSSDRQTHLVPDLARHRVPYRQRPVRPASRNHRPALALARRVPAEARLSQQLLKARRRAVEAPHKSRVQRRVGRVDRRRERLNGPEVEGRVHRAREELGVVGREGERGDGVLVRAEGV